MIKISYFFLNSCEILTKQQNVLLLVTGMET